MRTNFCLYLILLLYFYLGNWFALRLFRKNVFSSFRIKQRLHETLQIDREFTEEDFDRVGQYFFFFFFVLCVHLIHNKFSTASHRIWSVWKPLYIQGCSYLCFFCECVIWNSLRKLKDKFSFLLYFYIWRFIFAYTKITGFLY